MNLNTSYVAMEKLYSNLMGVQHLDAVANVDLISQPLFAVEEQYNQNQWVAHVVEQD